MLLKNEIQEIKRTTEIERTLNKEQIDRIYSLNQWLMGLLFTVALGLFSLVVPDFFGNKKKKDNENS